MRDYRKLRLIIFFGLFCLVRNLPAFAQPVNAEVMDNMKFPAIPLADTASSSVVIADVLIAGYKITKPYIILREVPFSKGQNIQRADLPRLAELCRQQLMNTTLFVVVSVKPAFITSDIVIMNITVKERWYLFPIPYFKMIDRNFNTWWVENERSLERVNYGLKFMQNNVSGRNDNLNIWLIGGYTQQVSIRYENPFLDKSLKHGMNVGFSYSRNREINYGTNFNKQTFFKNEKDFLIKQVHLDLAYTYRPAIKTRHNFRVSYNDLQIEDTVLKLNPTFFPYSLKRVRFPDISYSIQYFNVDYIPYPLKGFMGEGQIYKRFGRDCGVWELSGRATYTKPLRPSTFLQFQASGLIRAPFNQSYFNSRMFGSSDLYMRGMEYYVIDGVAGGVARATAIQRAINLKIPNPVKMKNLEKIPFQVYLKAFTDVGYSYNPNAGNSMFNNRLLKTWGVGLDIVTIYDVVLKLEYSFNQLGEKGLYIHTRTDW